MMRRAQRIQFVFTATVALALVAGLSWAFWGAGSVPGGSGTSGAAFVEAAARPTATASGGAVAVSWSPATLSTGDPVSGYEVRRYDAATMTLQVMETDCDVPVTGTSCLETSVPTGSWSYTVTSLVGRFWRGAESPPSLPVQMDATPPVNALSLVEVTGGASLNGNTVFFRGSAPGSFRLRNALSDTGSGPASSRTHDLTGSVAGWSHTPSTASEPAGGPYDSAPYSWAEATSDGPHDLVTGSDMAGNTSDQALDYVDDSTAPTGSTVAYADGLQSASSVNVALVTGTDNGSGLAARQLQRDTAVLTAGTCGAFSGFTDMGPDSPASPTVDDQLLDAHCYRYRYVVRDRVGNQEIATSDHVVEVQLPVASPSVGTAGNYSVLAGTGVANTGDTTLSGDLGVSPSDAISGFPPGIVAGTIHAGDTAAALAQTDLVTAYDDAAARTPDTEFSGDLNGRTFHAGIHHTDAALALTGTLTLDAENNPDAVFIFQVDAALNTAADSHVVLLNGAQASHVFWQVQGAAGTGATSTFSGTILAAGAITLGAGSQLIGSALSYGTVTLADNTIRFTVAQPPVITIDGGPAAVTKDVTPTLSGTTTAAPGTTVRVTVAGQTLTTSSQTDGTWSTTAAAIAAGSHLVVASVRDAAGNAGTTAQTLSVEVNPSPVLLGTALTYSVLAGTGVANTGDTTLSGDLGVSPSDAISGFPPGIVAGTIHAGDTAAALAQTDLVTAYDDAAARTPDTEFSGDLNGRTFHAGIHHTDAALALTGTLTLDAENNPDAVFIFQVDAALNTAADSHVVLLNGAQASHVFWQVQGAAGTGATSTFSGTILAAGAITLGAGSQLIGSALSYGTVTLADNTVRFTVDDARLLVPRGV
jgi:hypothetical protein